MRETLICIGKIGNVPFCFKETGVRVSSYEEICYYVSRHMICYLHTLPEPELAGYIGEELGLTKLSSILEKYTNPEKDQEKYFGALFREGNYFTEDEVQDILDHYRKLKNMSVIRQCKILGDLFLQYDKTAMAINCYEYGLKFMPDSEIERGNLYHNLGAAKLRMFHFQSAKDAFSKAFYANKNEDSLFFYYVSVALENGLDEARKAVRKFEGGDYVASAFEKRFLEMEEHFRESNTAVSLSKIRFAKEHGKDGAAARMAKSLTKKLQDDFRAEQEINENLKNMLNQD